MQSNLGFLEKCMHIKKMQKAGNRAGKGVAQEATANDIITRSDGQVDVEATQNAAADYMDSADDADLAAFFGVSDIYMHR